MSSDDEAILGGRTYKRPRQVEEAHPSQKQQKRKKHLYLVLDDWHEGFTIRKLDADVIADELLSAPPVLRLLSPPYSDSMFFATLGSHIIATSNRHSVTLVYDTATAGLAAGPPLPEALLDGFNLFVPAAAGDTLYAIAYYFMLRRQRVEVSSETTMIPTRDWSWRSLGPPSPFAKRERVWSYAVHPDGRTVFMSAGFCTTNGGYRTFSFDTAGDRTEWRCHGDWALPFEGQGYFDSDLDAWVGLDRDGHIGTCQVPSTTVLEQQQPPELDWKTAKDKLWDRQRQVALRPTLTCMGNARFCLVDCIKPVKDDGFRVLRVTLFRLRHSRKGELQIFDRSTSSCPVDKHTSFAPVAFWM